MKSLAALLGCALISGLSWTAPVLAFEDNIGQRVQACVGCHGKEGRAALVECLGKIACARDAGSGVDKCVKDRLAASPAPTAAQDKVRTDVCTQCIGDDAGVAACESEFFAKADGGPGIGTFVLEWNDGVATAMDTTCASAGPADGGDAGAQLACAVKFGVCATAVIGAALPKDACKDGG